MKKKPFKLTEEIRRQWSLSCLNFFQLLAPPSMAEQVAVLFSCSNLNPKFGLKGHLLLEPKVSSIEAYYIRKGSAKLYNIDSASGEEKIKYIWMEESVIILLDAFLDKRPNEKFYISLMEDSELVGISNLFAAEANKEHTAAFIIRQQLMHLKSQRRTMHIDILQMVDKKMRYLELKKNFNEFFFPEPRLTNEEICGFIEISKTTLKDARKIYPDE